MKKMYFISIILIFLNNHVSCFYEEFHNDNMCNTEVKSSGNNYPASLSNDYFDSMEFDGIAGLVLIK